MLFSYKIEMEDSGRDFSQGRLCSLCPEVGLISAAHASPEEPGSGLLSQQRLVIASEPIKKPPGII